MNVPQGVLTLNRAFIDVFYGKPWGSPTGLHGRSKNASGLCPAAPPYGAEGASHQGLYLGVGGYGKSFENAACAGGEHERIPPDPFYVSGLLGMGGSRGAQAPAAPAPQQF